MRQVKNRGLAGPGGAGTVARDLCQPAGVDQLATAAPRPQLSTLNFRRYLREFVRRFSDGVERQVDRARTDVTGTRRMKLHT